MSEASQTDPNKIIIPADDYETVLMLRAATWRDALTLLEDLQKRFPDAIGLGMATAVIGREEANSRASVAGAALRAVARAGHDISKIPSVYSLFDKENKPCFVLRDEPQKELF